MLGVYFPLKNSGLFAVFDLNLEIPELDVFSWHPLINRWELFFNNFGDSERFEFVFSVKYREREIYIIFFWFVKF